MFLWSLIWFVFLFLKMHPIESKYSLELPFETNACIPVREAGSLLSVTELDFHPRGFFELDKERIVGKTYDDKDELNIEGSEAEKRNSKLPLSLNDLQYHGTTTLSFIFQHGIIVAVDSRASMGKYVGSRTTKKVFPISKFIVGTMAGGAADCTYFIRHATRVSRLLQCKSGASISVKSIAKMISNNLRESRGSDLSVGSMIAGWDKEQACTDGNIFYNPPGGSPSLYYIDSEGSCIKGNKFSVGSGSSLAYSSLDERDLATMTVEDAVKHAMRAIQVATNRDGYSGGFINVFHINATGVHHFTRLHSSCSSRNIS